jgi:hypothetical protein
MSPTSSVLPAADFGERWHDMISRAMARTIASITELDAANARPSSNTMKPATRIESPIGARGASPPESHRTTLSTCSGQERAHSRSARSGSRASPAGPGTLSLATSSRMRRRHDRRRGTPTYPTIDSTLRLPGTVIPLRALVDLDEHVVARSRLPLPPHTAFGKSSMLAASKNAGAMTRVRVPP